ncbi:MAG: propanediol utilization protein [Planctomycetes bacterium]|jgi:microcompartment protein CcmL/EutN|nr:propanediol utilization protein [Planctomycetota bacterium]
MNRNDLNPEMREDVTAGPCIGLLELCSIARGVEVADAILKRAHVALLCATPVQPGKYVMLFSGSVQDVGLSVEHGAEIAADDLVGRLHIQHVHPQIETGLRRRGGIINGDLDAIGIVETRTVAGSILAADLALKTATVDLLDLRIANGLGGKSFFALTGEVSDVRSAVVAGAGLAEARGELACDTVIPRPHAELARYL